MTLKGAVGITAIQYGLCVTLNVLDEDTELFETYAEIQITNPAQPGRGVVRVTDDGALYWHCRLPQPEGTGLTVTDIAATLAQTLVNTGHTPRTRP